MNDGWVGNANAWPEEELGRNVADLEEFPIQNNLPSLRNIARSLPLDCAETLAEEQYW